MKWYHVVLAILTVAFILVLGVMSYKDRQEHPVADMTEEEIFLAQMPEG